MERVLFNPAKSPVQAPHFQGSSNLLKTIVGTVYESGEGPRYLFEQTIGYTIPRTIQQLNRTQHITGRRNKVAAYEMLARDLAADFADTILPGLLATPIIGYGVDKMTKAAGKETMVRHNLGQEALGFYEHVARQSGQTAQSYFENIEKALLQGVGSNKSINLEKFVMQPDTTKAAQKLAAALGLTHMDVELKHGLGTAQKKLEISLENLLSDLKRTELIGRRFPKTAVWGERTASMFQKTRSLTRFQMIGNVAALVSSLAIPFAIRLMTRRLYGKEAFPGSKALEDHFRGEQKEKADAPAHPKHRRFILFPYLSRTIKKGDYTPLAITAGFFAVLGTMVGRRFSTASASMFKLKDWFKVYQFDRSFPFTSLTQMELTYGLLCGTRLAASRNDAEFRETAIRDCLLGWPTLTYFFKAFREFSGRIANKSLAQTFRYPHMLIKPSGELRSPSERSVAFFKNMGMNAATAQKARDVVEHKSHIITAGTAALSWFLLAFAEPAFGIWLTNKLEVGRLTREVAEIKRQQAIRRAEMEQQQKPPMMNNVQGAQFAGAQGVFARPQQAMMQHA